MDFNDFNFEENNNSNNSSSPKHEEEEINNIIEIYIRQRNGRKKITTVYGIGQDKSALKNIAKQLRKKMQCSGTVVNDENGKLCLKFSGSNIKAIVEYLVKEGNSEENIRIHGV